MRVTVQGAIQVNLAEAPIPTNEYDADYAWAVERLDSVNLVFAKTSADGSPQSVSAIDSEDPGPILKRGLDVAAAGRFALSLPQVESLDHLFSE